MTATLQREHWNGQPTYLGDLFRVSKAHGDKALSAVCKLWTHAFGWEVRLEINDDPATVGGVPLADVLTAGETWKAAMVERGWSSRCHATGPVAVRLAGGAPRIDAPLSTVMVNCLGRPTSMVRDERNGAFYVTEQVNGRVVKIR